MAKGKKMTTEAPKRCWIKNKQKKKKKKNGGGKQKQNPGPELKQSCMFTCQKI